MHESSCGSFACPPSSHVTAMAFMSTAQTVGSKDGQDTQNLQAGSLEGTSPDAFCFGSCCVHCDEAVLFNLYRPMARCKVMVEKLQ